MEVDGNAAALAEMDGGSRADMEEVDGGARPAMEEVDGGAMRRRALTSLHRGRDSTRKRRFSFCE